MQPVRNGDVTGALVVCHAGLADRQHMHALPGSDLPLSGAVAVVDHDPRREAVERSLIGLLSGSGVLLGRSRCAPEKAKGPSGEYRRALGEVLAGRPAPAFAL